MGILVNFFRCSSGAIFIGLSRKWLDLAADNYTRLCNFQHQMHQVHPRNLVETLPRESAWNALLNMGLPNFLNHQFPFYMTFNYVGQNKVFNFLPFSSNIRKLPVCSWRSPACVGGNLPQRQLYPHKQHLGNFGHHCYYQFTLQAQLKQTIGNYAEIFYRNAV